MSEMNRRIERARAESIAETAAQQQQARANAEHEALQQRYRNGGFFKVAAGLKVLAGLLREENPPPEVWATYSRQQYVKPGADRNAHLIYKRPFITLGKDLCWYLGMWKGTNGSYSGADPYEVDKHNYITRSGKVIEGYSPTVDLNRIKDAESAGQRLGVIAKAPHMLVEQIVWTAGHYALEWPDSAPDLSKL
ncbi:MAG: hypothetical protein ABIQ89_01510 [Candidatus Saccharimonadales bacterium]